MNTFRETVFFIALTSIVLVFVGIGLFIWTIQTCIAIVVAAIFAIPIMKDRDGINLTQIIFLLLLVLSTMGIVTAFLLSA